MFSMLTSSRSSKPRAELLKAVGGASRTRYVASRSTGVIPMKEGSTCLRRGGASMKMGIVVKERSINVPRREYKTASGDRRPLFDKILIANRGEIACRVMKTAKKLGIKTVAIYSEVDKDSLHVQIADEAYCVGPAPSAESYLRIDKIIDIAKRSGAQAIHPGYGFLSENAKFATALEEAGITFIGPPVSAITSMASKSESKDIMSAAGVPCVPGYHGSNQSPDHLLSEARKIGFPVLIKAVLGGGGKGMRIVHSEVAFLESLESAKREAMKSFSDDNVLVEKYITRPRHIEVQVFGDTKGDVVSLWERDCSVQRRHQKIIEEAPAPGISEDIRKDLCEKAAAAAKAVGYVGAGTVEFIFDDEAKVFYFMEMNTRLQVEHPVTEMITNQDLVEWQLQIASGNPLPLSQSAIPLRGHAFEARIYAENPSNNFMPDVGRLLYLSTPTTSANVRLEEGFKQGAEIGVYYDPLIAKLVVWGEERKEALRALRRALEEYKIVGLSTNIEFLQSLATHPAFVDGDVETGFIPKHHAELFPPASSPSSEALTQTALFIVLRDLAKETQGKASPWSSLAFRRFGGDVYKRAISLLSIDGALYHVHVTSHGSVFDVQVQSPEGKVLSKYEGVNASLVGEADLHATINGEQTRPTIVSQIDHYSSHAIASFEEKLYVFSRGQRVTLTLPSPKWLLSLGKDTERAISGGLRAPMPSVIVDVKVKVGDVVKKGQAVVVLESMKTETVLRSHEDGVVKSVACKKGDMVEEGIELATIGPMEEK